MHFLPVRMLGSLFFIIILNCSLEKGHAITLKIVGGKNSAEGAWPWHSLIVVQKRNINASFICGGAVVDNNWVLTSADCIRGYESLIIVIGAWNLSNPQENRVIVNGVGVWTQPCYKAENLTTFSFAMVKLSETVSSRHVACIANFTDPNIQNNNNIDNIPNCIATGFGVTSSGEEASVLQEATFPNTSAAKCQLQYKNLVSPDKLCVYGGKHKDACNGDSGGPLVCPVHRSYCPTGYYIAGILIAGPKPCDVAGLPSIYQSTHYHVAWIKGIIRRYRHRNRDGSLTARIEEVVECANYQPIRRNSIKN